MLKLTDILNGKRTSHTLFNIRGAAIPLISTLLPGFISILLTGCLSILLTGCISETYPEPDSPQTPLPSPGFKTIDLPGYIGISVSPSSAIHSRAEGDTKPSNGDSFQDGLEQEYSLITDKENYHYIVIYDENQDKVPSAIIPLILSTENLGTAEKNSNGLYDNITLTASKIITASDFLSSENLRNLKQVQDLLVGKVAYALMNFDKSILYSPNSDNSDQYPGYPSFDMTKDTPAILSSIKKSDFLKLCLKDYKITVDNVNYFTMSNSVYMETVEGLKTKIIDNTIIPTNVFISEEDAKDSPAISVRVERLAVKYTVNFNLTAGNFDTSGADDNEFPIKSISYDANGLPTITLDVLKYDGSITFNSETGYKINSSKTEAKIKVLGYAVNNLEPASYTIKNIDPSADYFKNGNSKIWNDAGSFRCYWTEDPHYKLEKETGRLSNAKGYPHQFRQALDSDTVFSHHAGTTGSGYKNLPDPWFDTEKIGGVDYFYYNGLGEIDTTKFEKSTYLNYKSFMGLLKDYGSTTKAKDNTRPFYSLENTYYDPGMNNNTGWSWEWKREPYGSATNLMILAELEINVATNPPDGKATVYRGQNNIFYLDKNSLLSSKLEILNKVMLSGGNAGFQILHGQWDRHARWTEGDQNQYEDTHLDKVAWNENSILWIANPVTDASGNTIYDEVTSTDEEGKTSVSYKARIASYREATAEDLELIPAEISGGDGQRLIAPKQSIMGRNFRYFLAPEDLDQRVTNSDGSVSRTWIDNQKVEISYNHLVALIHKIIGPIDVYEKGYMYYAIPVPNNITTLQPEDGNGRLASWRTLGDIGTVRNNWYDITVNTISGIGVPVDNPYQPIVPVMDVRRSYINLGVRLLPWHRVIQDNVPLM